MHNYLEKMMPKGSKKGSQINPTTLRSGVLEHLKRGRFPPPTPSALGAYLRRGVQKRRFPRVLLCFRPLKNAKTAARGAPVNFRSHSLAFARISPPLTKSHKFDKFTRICLKVCLNAPQSKGVLKQRSQHPNPSISGA